MLIAFPCPLQILIVQLLSIGKVPLDRDAQVLTQRIEAPRDHVENLAQFDSSRHNSSIPLLPAVAFSMRG